MKSGAFTILALFIASSTHQAQSFLSRNSPEQLGYWSRFSENGAGYNPRELPRPFNKSTEPVAVKCSMYVLDVSKVDDRNKEFTVQLYFRQKWTDERIRDRFALLPGSTTSDRDPLILSASDLSYIWTPDLFFVNEKEGRLHKITLPNVFVRVYPDGVVFTSQRLSMTMQCRMDLRLYPHDQQKCTFEIESYGYKKSEMLLEWDDRKGVVSTTDSLDMPDFALLSTEKAVEEVSMSTGEYSRLRVDLTFRRQPGFYLTKLFVPYILLVAISALSFWINHKYYPLRLSLLLSVLLIMMFLASDMNGFIPPAPYTKAIDIWIGFCMSFVFVAFLELLYVCQRNGNTGSGVVDPGNTKADPENVAPDVEDSFMTNKKGGDAADNIPASMFIAKKFCKVGQCNNTLDAFFRLLYPLAFIIFNITYWSVYAS